NYELWAKSHDRWSVLAVEQDFEVPMENGHLFAGRWDMVVLHDHRIWINDFKTTGSKFDSYTQYLTDQDEQTRAYSWAGHQIYGDWFGGIMFTLIRNKAPQ